MQKILIYAGLQEFCKTGMSLTKLCTYWMRDVTGL